MWAITPKILDAQIGHRKMALSLVAGVRALTRRLPEARWFACTELKPSALGDSSLNCHAHSFVVLNAPKGGRRYTRYYDWPEAIEQAWRNASAYAIDCAPKRLVAPSDALRWASYLTKPASLEKYAAAVQRSLSDPEQHLGNLCTGMRFS